MAKKNGGKKKTVLEQRDIIKTLPVPITREELEAHVDRMTAALSEIETMEDKRLKLNRELKEKRGVVKEVQELLLHRTEDKEVQCIEKWDYEAGKIFILRKDDDQAVSERPMTAQDRQLGMFGKGGGSSQVSEPPPENDGQAQQPEAT